MPNAEKDAGLVWTCCDPNGVTFCVGCGEDVQRGRTLPHRVLPPGGGMPDPASLTPEESARWAEALDGRPRVLPPGGGDEE